MHLMLLLMASSDPVDQGTYKARYPTKLPSPQEVAALSRCLDAWSDHPFGGDISETEVRVVGGQVRVMGFGSSEPEETRRAGQPRERASPRRELERACARPWRARRCRR